MSELEGGAPLAPETSAAPEAPAIPTAPETAAAPATPTAPPAPAPTPQGGEAMVPSYRLRETRDQALRQAAQWAQAEVQKQVAAQTQTYQKQLQALTGMAPQENDEDKAIREKLSQYYPVLGQLTPEKLAQLEKAAQMLEQRGQQWDQTMRATQAQNQHYWNDYSSRALTRLHGLAEQQMGQLSDQQRNFLDQSFFGYVTSNPQVMNKLAQNIGVVDEFWSGMASGVLSPAQRQQAAAVEAATSAPAGPQDAPSGAVAAGAPAKPTTADDAAKAAWTSYQNFSQR